MCLAIYKPEGAIIPADSIRNGWIGNPDGGGYSFIRKGKVITRKGLMTLKDFMAIFEVDLKENPKAAFSIHFRIRSQGDKSEANTHPFDIAGGSLIHNGTLDGTGATYGEGESDTCRFAARYKDDLTFDTVTEHKEEFEKAIGLHNKMVMLYEKGKHIILNEKAGVWQEGVWYSNHSFKPRSTYPHAAANMGMIE